MFYFTDEDSRRPAEDLAAASGAFNVILASPALAAELPAAFKPMACEDAGSGRACLFRRPGRCLDAASPFAVNAVLARLDQ
jgi:hypothetical protein